MSTPEDPPVYTAGARIPALGDLNDAIQPWGPIHAFLWYACQANTLPPPAFYVGAVLPLIAHEAARRGFIFEPNGPEVERPRIQSVLIGPAASGKSSAMRLPRGFYKEVLEQTMGLAYVDPFVLFEGSIPGIVEVLAGRLDPAAGCTPVIMHLEEFSRILEQRDGLSEVFNQVFDGEDFARALRAYQNEARNGGKPPSKITAPAISGIFATTYAGLENTVTAMHREGGLATRMFWFVGEGGAFTLERPTTHSARTTALVVWTEWSRRMSNLIFRDSQPKVLSLNPSCKPYFQQIADELNAIKMVNAEDPRVPYLWRLVERSQQIAMLYAFSRGEFVAQPGDAWRAVNLVRFCDESIQHIRGRWTARSEDTWEQAQQCLAIIERAGEKGITRDKLAHAMRGAQRLDFALATLRAMEKLYEPRSRHPTRYFAKKWAPVIQSDKKPD